MIVIDCGAARYDDHYSMERLIEQFDPDTIYGFDPNEAVYTALHSIPLSYKPKIHVERRAAWIYDGQVRFMLDGMNGQVGTNDNWSLVPCFDLATFIEGLDEDETVLKLDVEMAEYPLLEHLITRNVDVRLSLALVEWHDLPDGSHKARRMAIERSIACPLEEWQW